MNVADFKMIPVEHRSKRRAPGTCVRLCILLAVLVLSACYYPPYNEGYRPASEVTGSSRQAPSTQVFFFPNKGQTTEEQSRDHYECYNWAIKQTGFDPGQSEIPTNERVRVVPMPPPGHDTTILAITGAVLGALIGGPRHAAGGALIGAAGGAIAGASSDLTRQQYAQNLEEAYSTRDRSREAQLDEKALGFRRAMSACLEGRGYSVR